MSKKYNRYFLIFNEEDKGFEAASDKQPTGYTKIETKSGKCKITVYAQNLSADKGPYICYLVDASKSTAKVAKLGELLVDDAGKGETVWEHDAKNISGTGLSSDKFNVAAVVKEGNRLQVPLAGYSGKDKVSWREKVNSRSFVEEVEDVKEVKEQKEGKESKKKKSKHSNSKKHDELREPLEDILESTNKDIKEQISEIVEQAESEVLEENKDIVEENNCTEEVRTDEEKSEEVSIEELIVNDNIEVSEEEIEEDIFSTDYDKQLQRDDTEYIESYSEEGMAFSHYEQEINLQDADVNYAAMETLEEEYRDFDIPEVKKLHVFNDERYKDESDEQYLCDARDIVAQSIDSSVGILHRACDSINLDRSKLCHDLKVDLEKLNKEVEKEVKKVLQRELEKYKKAVLKHVCKKEHNHCGHDNNKKKHEHVCEDKHHKMKHHHDCKDENHHGHHGHHNYHCHEKKEDKCSSDKHHKKKGYARILHGILSRHENISVQGAKDCNFWKVNDCDKFPNKDSSKLPYYSAIHHLKMTYPYINYVKYFKSKGYYYFGMKYDKDSEVKYLIYGIEGDKKESHQPYKGMTGFVSWVPHGDSGIWLMYYNPYTGCVMLPKGKGDKKR